MKSTTLTIQGMHCEGCARKISSRLAQQPGVRAADVSFNDGQARVLYDAGATSEDALASIVNQLGFQVVMRAKS